MTALAEPPTDNISKCVDLRRVLYEWMNRNKGVSPPYWVLTRKDFFSVIHNMDAIALRYPRNKSLGEITSFRFMNVIIVPYDQKLPLEGEAWAP